MEVIDYKKLAHQLVLTARKAGRFQLDIYQCDFEVSYKTDDSPVSQADIGSEGIILDDLARIAPNIPVLAEEAVSAGDIPTLGEQYFCVDPLDGTKEFVSKNDEFTVNIALIERGIPVFGLVYVPVTGQLYVTISPTRAVCSIMNAYEQGMGFDDLDLQEITARQPDKKGLCVMVSRSHMSDETETFLQDFTIAARHSAGSSLKFCRIAAGQADLYPRLTPTMFWDSAAGHAVVLAAGGVVETLEGNPLLYHPSSSENPFQNPAFIVWGKQKKL